MLSNCQTVLYIKSTTTYILSVLGQDKGYTVKYNPLPEGVPEEEAQKLLKAK